MYPEENDDSSQVYIDFIESLSERVAEVFYAKDGMQNILKALTLPLR